ncbi:hypothetical protein N7466_009580 [Penicillium verhagenii]|uniref:uncharacterized protein n=1 Tax=Penicillium verhagenii TaxID=1562060 RepID=UPI002545B0AE|nr:uncharacterized protein N7466_009580 [Penicillium verhagenii]KAJ5921254.1 hypothetical protein N7466_009580 [Penicillium verhagenii]
MLPAQWPPFSELPLDKSGPPGNAWGLFGANDQLGMLNHLTPEVVAAAATEIQTGIRVSLDWPLDRPSCPTDERRVFEHRIVHYADVPMNDDEVHMNTQSSSQWDGFRHFGPYALVAYRSGRFYNGHVQADFNDKSVLGIDPRYLAQSHSARLKHSIQMNPRTRDQNSAHDPNLSYVEWTQNGGIIGRGILIDYADWAKRNNQVLHPLESGRVRIQDIQTIIREQGIQIRTGDILFLRVGFTDAYNRLTEAEQRTYPSRQPGGLLGLEATSESLRWLWESRFAAVAGDSPSFERAPLDGPFNGPDVSVHQWALAGWGLPLGEMFDLEELSVVARGLGRYSFFLTSVPIKVPGGVASPPNAVAIF